MIQEKDTLMGLAHDIANILSGGRTTDDSPYSLRQILWWMKTTYATWQQAELDKAAAEGQPPNPYLIRRHDCLAVEELKNGECPCDPGNGKVLRVQMPELAMQGHAALLLYLGGQGFSRQFRKATVSTASAIANAGTRFHGPTPAYFLLGKHAYIVVPPEDALLDRVSVAYVPEDPTALAPSPATSKNLRFNIYSAANPYPLRAVDYMRKQALRMEGQMIVYAKPNLDKNNNANPD